MAELGQAQDKLEVRVEVELGKNKIDDIKMIWYSWLISQTLSPNHRIKLS